MKRKICVIILIVVSVLLIGCSKQDIENMYNDDNAITSGSNTYNLINSSNDIDGQQITGKFDKMEGMDTIWSFDADKDMDLEMTYLLKVTKGKIKLVLISPDDSITNLVEMTKESPVDDYAVNVLKIKKGKNRIKLVAGVNTKASFDIKIPQGDFDYLGQ